MDKKVLYSLSYGMYVVSAGKDRKNAQIANTVFQISSNPPTIGVSINKENFTHTIIEENGMFAVSILSEDAPIDFIGKLGFRSGRDSDKLEDLSYKMVKGVPVIIDYSVGYMVCKVINKVDIYTHTLFVGEVVEGEKLVEGIVMTYDFYRREKKGVTPPKAPSYIETKEDKLNEGIVYKKYRCSVCGYLYDEERGDPSNGIKPGTKFEDLPETWKCPVCGAIKNKFSSV